jgi:hypothetical protein
MLFAAAPLTAEVETASVPTGNKPNIIFVVAEKFLYLHADLPENRSKCSRLSRSGRRA